MPRQFSGWSVVWHQPGVGGLIGGLCSPAILCRWCVFIASRARWYDFLVSVLSKVAGFLFWWTCATFFLPALDWFGRRQW